MKVAIHQPNFLPWFPFFEKMRAADIFVLLCHCQFEKGKYQNRFKFEDRWHTMSVNHGLELIVDKRYVTPDKDWARIQERLPQFQLLLAGMTPLVRPSLADTNCALIRRLAKLLDIKTAIFCDLPTKFTATDRLLHICQQLQADVYLAGQSGANYLEPEKFERAGIKIEYQDLGRADKRHSMEVICG